MKVLVAAGIIALAIVGAMVCASRPASAPTSKMHYSLARIEVVSTPAEQERGLGGRPQIPDDYGMLFAFAKADSYGFWMKDMQAPIDIIWINDDGTVAGILDAIATSTYPAIFYPPKPIRYALETRAGLAKEHGWATSTQLSLPLR